MFKSDQLVVQTLTSRLTKIDSGKSWNEKIAVRFGESGVVILLANDRIEVQTVTDSRNEDEITVTEMNDEKVLYQAFLILDGIGPYSRRWKCHIYHQGARIGSGHEHCSRIIH